MAVLTAWLLAACRPTTPATPPPAPDQRTGVAVTSWMLTGEPAAKLRRDLDLVASTGAGWVRFDIDWGGAEPSRGRFDWEPVDRIVRAARARHLRILATLAYTPAWARPPGTTGKTPPTDPADYGRFARAAAARYSPRGVHHWELWNEANVTAFWEPRPDPRGYAALLGAGAAGVRAADPSATIVTAGLAPAKDRPDGATLSPRTFLRRLYDAGAAPSFDAVGIHPYTYPDPPLTPGPDNPFATLPETHQVMVDHGDGAKALWGTEYGAPTGTSSRAVSEADQARILRQGYEQWRRWPFAGPLFWYSHRDAGTDADDPEDNFGLVRQDRRPKPALAAIRALTTPPR